MPSLTLTVTEMKHAAFLSAIIYKSFQLIKERLWTVVISAASLEEKQFVYPLSD